MAEKWPRPPLVDAPFYAMIDGRDARSFLTRFKPAVKDPITGIFRGTWDGLPTEEEQAIALAQHKRLLELDPSAPAYELLFDRREFPMDPALMEKVRYVSGQKPKTIEHWQIIHAMLRVKLASSYFFYPLVSDQWKSAVESLENGVHEFFPLTLSFLNPKAPARDLYT
ncbi:MAG: hypothetical protein ACKVP7_10555 [Hyphomicrobiaceae bacterium]